MSKSGDSTQLSKADYIEKMNFLYDSLYTLQSRLSHTWINQITITAEEVIFKIEDLNLNLVGIQGDYRIAPHEILTFGSLEPTERKVFEFFAKNSQCFFDVGANMGWYSFLAARMNPHSKIHAFEPIPSTFKNLKRNLELNSLPQIHPHSIALSNRSGECILYTYPTGSVNASLENVSGRSDVVKISCEMQTLDDFAQSKNIQPDLIKIDVEGAELMVFQGAEKTILKNRPILFTEILRKWSAVFNYHPNDILHLLKSWNYRCFGVQDGSLIEVFLVDENTLPTNYFFLPTEISFNDLPVPIHFSEGKKT